MLNFDIFFEDYDLMQIPQEHLVNAQHLIRSINKMLLLVSQLKFAYNDLQVGFGSLTQDQKYRLPNSTVGAAKSAHKEGMAIDIPDCYVFRFSDFTLKEVLQKNESILEECGLYLEHPDYTPNHTHLQTRPTSRRVFIPY